MHLYAHYINPTPYTVASMGGRTRGFLTNPHAGQSFPVRGVISSLLEFGTAFVQINTMHLFQDLRHLTGMGGILAGKRL